MAAASPAAPDETSAGKSRKKLLLLAIGVLAAVAAWFMLMGPGAGAEETEVQKAPELGEVLQLEPITMNLSDGRLLKVGLALQLVLEPKEAEVTGSVALDEAIAFLGEHSYEQLAEPEARATAKKEFSKSVAKRYHGDVVEVYFTEFVMQ